jgi:phage gp36-like protein
VDSTNFSALPPDSYSDLGATAATAAIDAEGLLVSDLVDSYLRKRKTLPLTGTIDSAVVCVTQDIVAWRLLKFRGFSAAAGADEEVKKAKDEAYVWLTKVAEGLVEVGGTDSSSDQVDLMGPLSASDEAVDWNYQTRGSSCDSCGGSEPKLLP